MIEPVDDHLVEGRRLYTGRDLEECIQERRLAVSVGPDNGEVVNRLAQVLIVAGQREEAVKICREGIITALGPVPTYLSQWVLERTDDLDETEAYYRLALQSDPANTGARFALGQLLAKRQQRRDAEMQYRELLKCDPTHEGALAELDLLSREDMANGPGLNSAEHFRLGCAYEDQSRWDEAINHFRKSIRMDQSYSEAQLASGRCLLSRYMVQRNANDLHECMEALRRYITLVPTDVPARLLLANALWYDGQFKESILETWDAFHIDPSSCASLWQLLRKRATQNRQSEDFEAMTIFAQELESVGMMDVAQNVRADRDQLQMGMVNSENVT